jgi:hypothetical protein
MQIQILAHTLTNFWRYGGATAELRIYATQDFAGATPGVIVPSGNPQGDPKLYRSVTCVVNGLDLLIPSITLESTTDSPERRDVKYVAILHSVRGAKKIWLADFSLPHTLGNVTNWPAIRLHNAAAPVSQPDTRSYNPGQIDAQIAAAIAAYALTHPPFVNQQSAAQYGTLIAAYAANPITPTLLVISEPLFAGGADSTQPDNIQLMFVADGRLVGTAGETVTLTRAPLAAPDQRCFALANLIVELGEGWTGPIYGPWFGAIGDEPGDGTGTDNYLALQAAIDCMATFGKGRVILPATFQNKYRITQPLYHAQENLSIVGEGSDSIRDFPMLWGDFPGPLLVCGKPAVDLTFGAALLSGGGQSLTLADNTGAIQFNDTGLYLDGLAQMSVEITCQATAYSTTVDNYANIFSSYGVRSENPATLVAGLIGRAFELAVDGAGKIRARMTIGGTLYTLTGGAGAFALNVNNNLHLRYTGATIELRNNGVLLDSEAATGTVTQKAHEDCFVGPFPLAWPEYSSAQVAQAGKYDNARISNTARSTANPTAKFTPDANTLLLSAFKDVSRYPLIAVEAGAAKKGWVLARNQADGGYTHSVGVDKLAFFNQSGPALLLQNCPTANIGTIAVSGVGKAAHFAGFKYNSRFGYIRATSFANPACRVGVCFSGPPGANARADDFDIEGFVYPLVGTDGLASVNQLFANTDQYTIALMYWMFGALAVKKAQFDVETAAGAGVTREAVVIFSGMQQVSMPGALFNDAVEGNYPHILLDYPRPFMEIDISGARFTGIGGDSVIANSGGVRSNGVANVNITGCTKLDDAFTATAKPWIMAADEEFLNAQDLGKETPPRALGAIVNPLRPMDVRRTLVSSLSGVSFVLVPAGLPAGFCCRLAQGGAGAAQVVGASGVTITAPNGAKTNGAGAVLEIVATGANNYIVRGDAAASVFTPLTLHPAHWYAADHITGYSHASDLNSWIDSSGFRRDATPFNSSKRPEYRTNVKNGLPGVFFDGANYDGEGLGHLDYSLEKPCTMIALYAPVAGSRITAQGALTGSNTAILGTDATNHIAKSQGTTISGGAIALNTYKVAVLTIGSDGAVEYLVNNVSVGAATGGLSPQSILLSQYNDFPGPLIGYGLEFLTFESVLSAANLTAIYNYLVAKWGAL